MNLQALHRKTRERTQLLRFQRKAWSSAFRYCREKLPMILYNEIILKRSNVLIKDYHQSMTGNPYMLKHNLAGIGTVFLY